MAKERINITLDAGTRGRLVEIAEKQGKSVSAVISSWVDRDMDTRIEELKLLQKQNDEIFKFRNKVYAEVEKAITECNFERAQELMRLFL